MSARVVRRHDGRFRWDDVDVLEYKDAAGEAHFKDVTRQVLFDGAGIPGQVRYFEVAPGGYTTLERHEHVHAVMVIRGSGRCLVGDAAYDLAPQDLVTVPSMAWHQFLASADAPLGFICIVPSDRDRPQLPDASEVAAIQALLSRPESD